MKDRFGRTPEEAKALQAKIAAANAEARDNWDNPQWRHEMAQEMSEVIYRGFDHENLVSLLAETESLPFEGRSFVREVRGLRAFWVARGGFIEASDMHTEVMEIQRDTVGFHVTEFEDKLMTNFAETQATLVELGIRRLDSEINSRVLRTFQAAIPNSSPYYTAAGGLSLATLNTKLAEVRDTSQTRDVAIIGRYPMTDQIMNQLISSNSYPAFLPETNEALLRTGVLGTYRGAKIINLVNYRDDVDAPFFPANELYIVSRDASKFAFFGGLMTKDFVEDAQWMWHYMTRRDFGGVVHRPNRLRRIVDTNISATQGSGS